MGKTAAQNIEMDKAKIVITGSALSPVCLQALKKPITEKTLKPAISTSPHDINISDLVPMAPSSLTTSWRWLYCPCIIPPVTVTTQKRSGEMIPR